MRYNRIIKQVMAVLSITIFINQLCPGQELKREEIQAITNFINYVKEDKKEAIAAIVSYPLKREYPIPSIKDKQDFVKKYEQIFDSTLIELIITSDPLKDWDKMGWRGIMLGQGEVWIDYDGKIIAINYQSLEERELRKSLLKSDKSKLHSSLAFFKGPVCILETPKTRIRIDEVSDNNFRYASWPLGKPMSEKPDNILRNGTISISGTGGNHSYLFKYGELLYECYISVLGTSDSAPATVTISKGDIIISSENANIMR